MIYLDNAATTSMHPEVLRKLDESMRRDFGNSGTVYRPGFDAKKRLEESEATIRQCLHLPGRYRLIFTSGGSESNNLFIKGLCFPDKRSACLGLEHPSISATLEYFKEWETSPLPLLPYQEEGRLRLEGLEELKKNKIRLLCLSHVNNELGSINPISKISERLKNVSPQTRLFVDGVQAVGKFKYSPHYWQGISGYSLSAHKIHGPKGIGLLIVDENLPLKPLIHGGKQQYGMRSGTLPVPLIVAMAEAIRLAVQNFEDTERHFLKLRRELVTGLKDLFRRKPHLNLKFNSSLEEDPGRQSPAIVNFSFAPVEGEVVLHHLEENEIYVGMGSACSAHSKEPSKILTGIGLTRQEAQCSLRISFSKDNTVEEISRFLHHFEEVHDRLFPTFSRKIAHT